MCELSGLNLENIVFLVMAGLVLVVATICYTIYLIKSE